MFLQEDRMRDNTSENLQSRFNKYIRQRIKQRGRVLSYEEYEVEGFAWLLCQPEWEYFIL